MTSCATPISLETLVAWWTGELPGADSTRVEEHLFACDECANATTQLAKLATGLHEHLPAVISHARRDRLVAEGARIRLTSVEAGIDARALFSHDLDLLIHVLRADLSHAERVDVDVILQGRSEPIACQGVPFDAKAGEVLICCQRHFRHWSPVDPTFRLYAVEAGERHLVGDYLVHHEFPADPV